MADEGDGGVGQLKETEGEGAFPADSDEEGGRARGRSPEEKESAEGGNANESAAQKEEAPVAEADASGGMPMKVKKVQKRNMCKFWQRGECEKEDLCGFAHHESELNTWVPDPTLLKMVYCEKYHHGGECKYGDDCWNIHTQEDRGKPLPAKAIAKGYGQPGGKSGKGSRSQSIQGRFNEGSDGRSYYQFPRRPPPIARRPFPIDYLSFAKQNKI